MINPNQTAAMWTIRWLARVGAIVSVGLLTLIALGQGGDVAFGPLSEMMGLLFFPISIVAGMLVAWRWEIAGGSLTLLGLVGFYLWHFAQAGSFPAGPWFLVFALPGLVMLLVGVLSIASERLKPHESE